MTRGEFFDLLARFARRPFPAIYQRHIYIWQGSPGDLLAGAPAGLASALDLHTLCGRLEKTPAGEKAAVRALDGVIDAWQAEHFPSTRPRALLISGVGILYRYNFPLGRFHQLAGDDTAVIFCLPAEFSNSPARALPAYAQFAPQAVFAYLAAGLPAEAIVREE